MVALILLLVVGAEVWSARNERGLVVDTFSVPPDLARDGLTAR